MNQVVAVKAVTAMPLKVDVIEAGAAVEHGIVDDEALEMKDAQKFSALYRHTVNRHARPELLRHSLVACRVTCRFSLADQPALRPMPVDVDGDFELRVGRMRRIEGIENLAAGIVILQVECGDQNAPARAGDLRQQGFAESAWASQRLYALGRNG